MYSKVLLQLKSFLSGAAIVLQVSVFYFQPLLVSSFQCIYLLLY